MDITRHVNTFGCYLQSKYGERIHKFSVNAHFQSYSNTYGDLQELRKLYDAALTKPDAIGLCVSG